MKKYLQIIVVLFFVVSYIKAENKKIEISLTNAANISLNDFSVKLNFDELKTNNSGLKECNFIITDGEETLPSQVFNAGNKTKLIFNVNLKAKETKVVSLVYGEDVKQPEYKTRVHAELSMKPTDVYYEKRFRGSEFKSVKRIKVPSIHTDHDALFRYEGPGWESELIGYRFYLDWRNTTDIFGKKTNKLLLSTVGVHDTVAKDDSYHSMQDWGMDIFKVGSTLGIGSISMFADNKVNMVSKTDSVWCEITSTGPVRAEIKTEYYGWLVGEKKYNLESKISICAGSKLSKVDLAIQDADNMTTGLAKHPNTEMFESKTNGNWNYIALYGKQSLAGEEDKLGIALFYKESQKIEVTEDPINYIVKLKPNDGKVTYYFTASWEQEINGVKSIEEFKNYLDETLIRLENPVTINIK